MRPYRWSPLPFGSWANEVTDLDAVLADADTRIVGWGTGSVFDYFHHRHPLPLAYLVDNDATRWGDRRAGVTIFGPDRLRHEDPTRTLVIVYSGAWPEIAEQVAGMGFARVAAASAFFTVAEDDGLRARLGRAQALTRQPVIRRPSGDCAIVIQGPIIPDMTACALRLMAVTHPSVPIVLSTWDTTDADLLTEVVPFVDDVVLSPLPERPGIQNRNMQILSTRAGIARARDLGATTVLKSRTDVAVLVPDVFEQAARLRSQYPATAARARGLRERLLVPSSYTRKYLLYHPSDSVMLGAIDDLETYWSVPLDARTGKLEDDGRRDVSLRDLSLDGNPSETYLGLHYCRTVGRPVTGDVADSWAMYRDLFAVVDNAWFELLWLKNIAIPDLDQRHGPRQLVDHAFWRGLVHEQAGGHRLLPEIDPARITLQHFGAAA